MESRHTASTLLFRSYSFNALKQRLGTFSTFRARFCLFFALPKHAVYRVVIEQNILAYKRRNGRANVHFDQLSMQTSHTQVSGTRVTLVPVSTMIGAATVFSVLFYNLSTFFAASSVR